MCEVNPCKHLPHVIRKSQQEVITDNFRVPLRELEREWLDSSGRLLFYMVKAREQITDIPTDRSTYIKAKLSWK